MKHLSVAIATFNEENKIADCLKSVYGWVDEIVLVDGTSSDRTVEIAKKYKAKVSVVPNHPMFHKNKQTAIDHCAGEWVLQLDADEIVSPQLKKEIATIIQQSVSSGYWIPRKNFFLGRFLMKGGQYPNFTLRLFRRGKGKLPCKSVHEQVVVLGSVDYLSSPLLHFSYPNFEHYIEHFNRYTDILAGEIDTEAKNGKTPGIVNFLFLKPSMWFLKTYLRHKGFLDGVPGFIFSVSSAFRFPIAYSKWRDRDGKK